MNILIPQCFLSPENGPTKNLKEVQNDLMGFINADTILVGHGLENDLRYLGLMFWNSEMNEMPQEVLLFMKFYEDITTNMNDNKLISFHTFLWPSTIFRALQLVHSVVLDTSAVFPHYCGLPYRRSLRSLVSSYLKVSIYDNIAIRLGNLTLKDRQHRQCVVRPVWPWGLLCLYLRCFKWRFRQNVFFSARSNPHGATTPTRMLGLASTSCSGRLGTQCVVHANNCLFTLLAGKMAVAEERLWWKLKQWAS